MLNFFAKKHQKLVDYIYDPAVDIKKRSFILFSIVVLIALFLAIPCGIIMHEPPMATISTFVGCVFFVAYVVFAVKKKKIEQARIVLSVILVFIFLPAMFFTNGGVLGGTPIWLLLGTIYITMILDGRLKFVMLILNVIVTIICWIVGYYHPELITEYSRAGNFIDTLAALIIVSGIVFCLMSFQLSLFRKDEEDKNVHRLFEQTATALVNAIDAKDEYTHGHSARVAEYSRMIAKYSGKSRSECDEIYYVALLHDVGKIGIPEAIINKEGKLSNEEYAIIKQHPELGAQILNSITEYPNLIIGAHFHHERYDGKGYPDGLKGEDIPEIARIISVADAYDAMTSKRSYRDPIPQQTVREEIVKGAGTQFDPKFAKVMQHLIDLDSEYKMKEKGGVKALAGKDEITSKTIGDVISDGIHLTPKYRTIRFKCEAAGRKGSEFRPSLIMFDSLDARYHDTPNEMRDLNYYEYAKLSFDGTYELEGARKIEVEKSEPTSVAGTLAANEYMILAVRFKDHALIRIDSVKESVRIIVALPDSARYAYIGLTGENCRLYDVDIVESEEMIDEQFIPRIAEEVSYIKGYPVGDIPNIQVDGYRNDSTEGISIEDGMKIVFHTMSLPTARLVWHCAFVDVFYSENKMPGGPGYKEYALIRLDGENWEAIGTAKNKLIVNKTDDFEGWDAWKEANKKGYDCTVTFTRKDDIITVSTENVGISIKSTITILEKEEDVYVSLTGDQCAITNIRVIRQPDEAYIEE